MGRGNKAIFKDFYESSGAAFQTKCFEWLQFLFPEIRNAVALGEVDRDGVDLYTVDAKSNYLKVVQCKGFEKTFSESQLSQCTKSISTFIKKKQRCDEYLLILNHEVNTEQHRLLNKEIKRVKDSGLANSADYLTPKTFVNYYNNEFQKYILAEISKSNQRFFENYNAVMEQKFYLENVPFSYDSNIKYNKHFTMEVEFGPTSYLWKICENDIKDLTDKAILSKVFSKFIFVISEFGFGKTSLLFNFFHFLISKNYTPVYLPVSSFRAQTFDNTSNIAKEIFRTITQADFDKRNKFLKFSAEAMGTLLVHNPHIVLMFDGLDEHKSLYNKDGLKTLFESTNDLVAPIIFSFRKSFWEERQGDFEFSRIKPNRKNTQSKLFLTEWPESTIEDYIQLFVDRNIALYDEQQFARLQELKKIIQNNEYRKYYGDIPKRPLFLEMIIRDVLNGSVRERNISELYLGYFSEKFRRDLMGQIEGLRPQRYVPDMSIDATEIALIEIHEKLAGHCIKIEETNGQNSLVIENIVNENDIMTLIIQHNITHDIGKFLPLSVLVPISKRNVSRMKVKFVHKSFMEFFVAKYLFDNIASAEGHFLKILDFEFPTAITNFFTAIVEVAIKEQPSTISAMQAKLKPLYGRPLVNVFFKKLEQSAHLA